MNAQVRAAGGSSRPLTTARNRKPWSAALIAGLLLTACGGTSAPPGPAATDAPVVEKSGSARPVPAEPVTFFRSQAPACRAHAKKSGNPQVEAARFIRASLVDSLGGGSFLIRDGFGLRLVVRPADRVVLPASGRDTDEMPAPYAMSCPPGVFKGARS